LAATTTTAVKTTSTTDQDVSSIDTVSADAKPLDVDFSLQLEEGGGANAAPDGQRPSLPVNTQAGMIQLLDIFKRDIVRQWAPLFDQLGIGQPEVTFEWVKAGEQSTMACTLGGSKVVLTTNHPNAYYCPDDNTIYMPVQTFITANEDCLLFEIVRTVCDDMSVGGIMAHEFGHAITNWLTDGLEQQGNVVFGPIGKYRELFPDCLAGMYFRTLQDRGFDEPGDFDALVRIMGDIGDYDFSSSDHHGTPSERSSAVMLGASTNEFANCRIAYGPVVLTSYDVAVTESDRLPPPNPPQTVTTIDGHTVRPVSTSASEKLQGANGAPEASEESQEAEYEESSSPSGANAAPTTQTYTIYDPSAQAEQNFNSWWFYEAQIPTAQTKPFEEVYIDGVTVCSYRAMGYQAEQIWRHFEYTKGYAGTDAAALVASAFRGLCPTQVELNTTPYAVTGFKTQFDTYVDSAYWQLKYSPNITNLVGTPTLFDLGFFTKHTCHGMRMYGNTPTMLQYLVDNAYGPHGSTYLPVLAVQKDGVIRSDGVFVALTRLVSHAANCMSAIGG
jgi:predicted metalloprotease